MAPGRARDERKERQWRRWIGEWQASGLSVRAFCERRGLALPTFYAWRRTLERRAAEGPAFVPVQVVADAAPTQAGALEVVLPDGRTVRVAPGFDAATLRQLLAVLGGRPC
jgi:hypothetical protein